MKHAQHTGHQRPSFWKTPLGIGAVLVAVVASAYLYLNHQDHAGALLPFLLLAACPLMHLFMHRGHGGHGRHTHVDQAAGSGQARDTRASG